MDDGFKPGVKCPECREPMIVRTNRENGSRFLGCAQYPDCTATMPIPEHIRLREAGLTPLPGF